MPQIASYLFDWLSFCCALNNAKTNGKIPKVPHMVYTTNPESEWQKLKRGKITVPSTNHAKEMANLDKNLMLPAHLPCSPAQTIPKIAVTRQTICIMTANNILIKEFSKLNIRFPQSPPKALFFCFRNNFYSDTCFQKEQACTKEKQGTTRSGNG